MSIKKLLSLAFVSLLALTANLMLAKSALAAGPPFEGRIYNRFNTQIPSTNASPNTIPNVRWCWDVDENGDGNTEEDCTTINNGVAGSRPDTSGWINESTGKYFYFSQANAAGCGPEISNNRMTIASNDTYPGNFSFTRAQSPIYNDDGDITGWRSHNSIDDAYDDGGGNLPEYYKVEFNYTPPAPSEFFCRQVTMEPNSNVLQQGFGRTLTSTVNRPTIATSYFSVYKTGGGAVCIPQAGAPANENCPENTKHLTFNGEILQGGINGRVTIPYDQLAVEDKDGVVNRNISITAFHTSTDSQYAGSRLECIKSLRLIDCGGINPNTVTLAPNQNTQVTATSLPREGLEEGTVFALYQNGNRVCSTRQSILDFPNDLALGESCGGTDSYQVTVKSTLTGGGTQNAVATATFKESVLKNFIQANTDYSYTAIVKVYGQNVGSRSQCIGSLRRTATPPTTVYPSCTSKQAIELNSTNAMPQNIPRGTVFRYRININNPSQRGANVVDVLPSQLEYQGMEAPTGCQFDSATNTLRCNQTTATTVTFKVKVKDTASGSFTNTATVSDSLNGNQTNTCQVTNAVTPPQTTPAACQAKTAWRDIAGNTAGNYQYTQQINANTQLAYGQQFVYRVQVTNPNNQQYTLVDTLPTQVTFVDATAGCQYAAATRKVTCTNTTAPTVGIRVVVNETTSGGTVTNTATVNGNSANCSIAHTLPALPTAPPGPMCLSITLNHPTPGQPLKIGDQISFTCGQVQGENIRYEFRYKRNTATDWFPISALSNPINKSANITIAEWGTFSAQCRICQDRSCQPWESN